MKLNETIKLVSIALFVLITMCSDTNINKGITDSSGAVTKTAVTVYSELITCVNAQIAATNCNFPQNKVAHPALAKSGFFSSCDAPAGLIITLF